MPNESRLNLLSYLGTHPELAGPPRHAGANSAIVGRITLGRDAWLGAASVIRADGHYVRAGDDLTLGHGATVHIAHDVYPTVIGNGVTIGSNAVIHACEVRDGCIVEDGAVILDGCVIEAGTVIEAGSVVYPRSKLEGGHVYAGKPAKAKRTIDAAELANRRQQLRRRLAADPAERAPGSNEGPELDGSAFVANTAALSGRVVAGPQTSIWYGCELDAAGGEIVIGEVPPMAMILCSEWQSVHVGASRCPADTAFPCTLAPKLSDSVLWQLAQSCMTGSWLCTNGPRFSAWQV